MPEKRASTSLTARRPSGQRLWETARCHRLIRPLNAKLLALKNITQTLPSTKSTIEEDPKPVRIDPDKAYRPSLEGKTTSRRRVVTDRGLFFGESRVARPVRRTYSGQSSRSITPAVVPASVYDQALPAAAPNWDAVVVVETERETVRNRRQVSKEPDTTSPQALLASLKPFVHGSVYAIYTGICTSLETLLSSTMPPKPRRGPASLKDLAARKIAHCILATSGETDSDDVWYDTAAEIGVGGEYLREIVRWHGVEIIREAIRSHFMPTQKNGIGLAGILVGICKANGADAEAESLLKSMFELHPLSTKTNDPAFATLMNFWRSSEGVTYRILIDNMVSEGTPVSFGNTGLNELLKAAIGRIEKCEMSRKLIIRAFESACGIWGESHIASAAAKRKENNRRKADRLAAKRQDQDNIVRRNKLPPLPAFIGNRAENMALYLTEKLVVASFNPNNSGAAGIIQHLVQGFITQDESVRLLSEDAWDKWYPVAPKALLLAYSLGKGSNDDRAVLRELTQCLEDIRGTNGNDGLKSIGEFIAGCYEKVYNCGGKPTTERDEMKHLINRLLSFAARPEPPSSTTSTTSTPSRQLDASPSAQAPKTPHIGRVKVITFTPGKQEIDRQHHNERYYSAQLALRTAIAFSSLPSTANLESWLQWVEKIEFKVIGLKIRTPAKVAAADVKERKGWKWEEGISEWVAVGHTPGKGLLKPKTFRRPLAVAVEVPLPSGTWRDKYTNLVDDASTSSAEDIEPMDDNELTSNSESEPEPSEADDDFRPTYPRTSIRLADTDTDSEPDPDTSYSQLFDMDSNSSASEFSDDDKAFYAPTPAKPPSSIRHSPRSAARICRSLKAFSVVPPPKKMGSSPFSTTPAGQSSSPLAAGRSRRMFSSDDGSENDDEEGRDDDDDEHEVSEYEDQDEVSASEEEEPDELLPPSPPPRRKSLQATHVEIVSPPQKRKRPSVIIFSPRKQPLQPLSNARWNQRDGVESEDELSAVPVKRTRKLAWDGLGLEDELSAGMEAVVKKGKKRGLVSRRKKLYTDVRLELEGSEDELAL